MDLDTHLSAIASGDADAFGLWVACAERPVRESLRSFAIHLDTESVVQETLLRIWQVAPRVEPDGRANSLLRLAVRIGRNLAVSELRRARATGVDPDVLERLAGEEGAIEASPLPDPLLRRALEACREKLPPKPGQALAARIDGGGSEPDETLAERLGMRLNTFLQNFTRARKMLAECLREKGIALDDAGAIR